MRIIHRNKNCAAPYSIIYMWKESIICSYVKENKFFPSSFIFKLGTQWIWPQRDVSSIFHLIMSIFFKSRKIYWLCLKCLLYWKKKKKKRTVQILHYPFCLVLLLSHASSMYISLGYFKIFLHWYTYL